MEQINLNGITYIKAEDVNFHYTRKDEVVIDNIVLKESLKKLNSGEFLSIVISVSEHHLKNNWFDSSDIISNGIDDYHTLNGIKLATILNLRMF